MSKPVIAHKIKEGERWDLIAHQYYGDIGEINRLINANPHLSFCEVLPTGETLLVPIIKVKENSMADLPPWMQE
ncbi:tail protein X [Pasteurella skyensis]|uniref:Tail protein X n=1 Tax=Phocoenobacter skyensis TaxID=97481 RepID=A0AAJ6N9C5_9PAST|nr:tail protein X [Pasteurella skyensis]MDP8162799.1 tail protein X [Pasteurella skyensis]MDP8172614.1 tail protein X [Pasteurella skyensis]MDP8179114.1 tail protein X [Pasteurella skyensis]MDP8183201.1 tail protein X [Pasteurella skyensis]MDP8189252.1 tail protein X [Pasteurella skyensis]